MVVFEIDSVSEFMFVLRLCLYLCLFFGFRNGNEDMVGFVFEVRGWVWGFGLGLILSFGLSLVWRLDLVSGLCLGWFLFWFEFGVGFGFGLEFGLGLSLCLEFCF